MIIKVAGAGAGKTTAMSDLVVQLRKQVDKNKKIFCLAFTNSAVDCVQKKLNKQYGEIPDSIVVLTIHSFFFREIIKPYYYLLYGKHYKSISVAELPSEAVYRNAKIKRLEDNDVLHQSVIPERAKWVVYKKTKDTKIILNRRKLIRKTLIKYCGAICIDEAQDIDSDMKRVLEEFDNMGIPIILTGDPKQDIKGYKCFRDLIDQNEINVTYLEECHRCPKNHIHLSNVLVNKKEKQKSQKSDGQILVLFEKDVDIRKLITENKFDLIYISQKQGSYDTHKANRKDNRLGLAEELEQVLRENHPTKEDIIIKKTAYFYSGKMIACYKETNDKKQAMHIFTRMEKIENKKYGIIINAIPNVNDAENEKVYVQSIDYVKGQEGNNCLFILTKDLAEYLFGNKKEENKTKNKLYVALTRSLKNLTIYIGEDVEYRYSRENICKFFDNIFKNSNS